MLFRKLLPLFAAAIALLFSLPARAQLGLYGTFNGERVHGFTCQDPSGECASSGGEVRPYGGNFGAYYDFRTLGPVRLGVDVRGNIFDTNKSAVLYEGGGGLIKQYGALGGVRAEVNVPYRILHPYGDVLVGLARTNAASLNPQVYTSYTQVQGVLGLDVSISSYLDIRAIEFGAGEIFGSSSHSTESIGAGIVFHLPR